MKKVNLCKALPPYQREEHWSITLEGSVCLMSNAELAPRRVASVLCRVGD
jgi:hypothetical protein